MIRKTKLPSFKLDREDLQDLVSIVRRGSKVKGGNFYYRQGDDETVMNLDEVLEAPNLPALVKDFAINVVVNDLRCTIACGRFDRRLEIEGKAELVKSKFGEVSEFLKNKKNRHWIFHSSGFSTTIFFFVILLPIIIVFGALLVTPLGRDIFVPRFWMPLPLSIVLGLSLALLPRLYPYGFVEFKPRHHQLARDVAIGIFTSIVGSLLFYLLTNL